MLLFTLLCTAVLVVTQTTTEEPPVNCPDDILAYLAAGRSFLVLSWVLPIAPNGLDIVSSTRDQLDIFTVGQTVVVYNFTDSVRSRQESCNFTVTVMLGDFPPVIKCPNDVTVFAPGGTSSSPVTWDDVPLIQGEVRFWMRNFEPGEEFPLGDNRVTYQWRRLSQEEFFTCSFTVTVIEDYVPPSIDYCPDSINDMALPGAAGKTVEWEEPVGSGDVILRNQSHQSGDIFPKGTTQVFYDFEDMFGNMARCAFTVTVTVEAYVPPIPYCPGNLTGVAPLGAEGKPVRWEGPPLEGMEGLRLRNQSHRSGDVFPIGTTVVTYEYEDLVGNLERCSFIVTVEEDYAVPISVTNCPVEGYSLPINVIRPTNTFFGIPEAEGPRTRLTREPSEEDDFNVGITSVVYTFTDESNPRNTATCAFNVTIIPKCGRTDQTLCFGESQLAGDVCKATVSLCESDEGSGIISEGKTTDEGSTVACKATEICGDVNLLNACTERQEWQDALETAYPEGDLGFVSRFEVPAIGRDSVYLTSVRVAWGQFEELYSREITNNRRIPFTYKRGVLIFVDITITPFQNYVETFWVYPGLTTPDIAEVDLRVPLAVQPGDIVQITVGYMEDAGYPCYDPSPIQSRCTECLFIQYRTPTADCKTTDVCLQDILSWKRGQAPGGQTYPPWDLPDPPRNLPDPPRDGSCPTENHDAAIEEIITPCLPMAEIQFVSPDQTAAVGNSVFVVCSGTGMVYQPVVEWYDVGDIDGDAKARGNGSAVLNVSVDSTPQRFRCFLDRYTQRAVVQETVTTVYPISDECERLSTELRSFSTEKSGCFSLSKIFPRTDFFGHSLTSWTTKVFIYQITVSSSVLRAELVLQYGKDAVPEVVSIALEIRPGFSIPQRKRRGASRQIVEAYRRRYDQIHMPDDPATILTFDLTPPLRANSSFAWVVQFTLDQPSPRFRGELEIDVIGQTLQAVALNCSDATSSSCADDRIAEWSNALERYKQAGCDPDRSYRSLYEAYRVCKNISVAEPQIVESPSSANVLSIIEGRESLVTFDCFIENAVEYRWYKTAPALIETLIETGNQLVLQVSPDPSLQGAFVCEGVAGRPYENEKVRTEPATLALADITTFKVTMTLLNRTYTDDLEDTESDDFQTLSSELIKSFWDPLLYNGNLREELDEHFPLNAELLGFRSGSVIADVLVYFQYRFRGPGRGECDGGPCQLTKPTGDSALLERFTAAIQEMQETSELMVEYKSINVVNLVSCPQEVLLEGNLTFPETRLGETAQSLNLCLQFTTEAGMPRATRDCVGDFISQPQWKQPIILECFESVSQNLDDLAKTPVDSENAMEVSEATVLLTSNASAIRPMAITSIAGILEKLAAANNTSPEVAVLIVRIVNNVLQVDDQVFVDEAISRDNSPSRIVLALESFVTSLQNSGAGNFTEVQSSIAVRALSLPRQSLTNGLGFASSPGDSGTDDLTTNQTFVFTEDDPPLETDTSIYLSAEILDHISKGDSDRVPISFFLYQNSKLFSSPTLNDATTRRGDELRRVVGSRVIAATVEGNKIDNLRMPITSVFNLLNVSGPNETVGGAECVFWDFTLNNNYGDWSSEGCKNESLANGVVRCLCDHLTSFAAIVAIHGTQESVFLDVISKLGCGVSVVALIITLVTYLYSKKLRTKRPQRILINLCFALLALYVTFLAGIEAKATKGGCILVAVLLHYFTLASIAWMAVEAANMYLLFVRVLNANVPRFLLKAAIAAWGLPMVIVVIILAADYRQYENKDYCFLRPGNAIYYGQMLPIGLVLLFNFAVFTVVTRKLTCARKTIGTTSNTSQRQETLRRLQNAVAISVLLGLTWVFGVLAVFRSTSFAFQILFAIFNSLQGLMIFVLFCARQKEVHQVWREMFHCKKDGTAVSGTGLESSSRGGIALSSKATKTTDFSEASHTQS